MDTTNSTIIDNLVEIPENWETFVIDLLRVKNKGVRASPLTDRSAKEKKEPVYETVMGNRLTGEEMQKYEQMMTALKKKADEIYHELDPVHAQVAEKVKDYERLVTINEDGAKRDIFECFFRLAYPERKIKEGGIVLGDMDKDFEKKYNNPTTLFYTWYKKRNTDEYKDTLINEEDILTRDMFECFFRLAYPARKCNKKGEIILGEKDQVFEGKYNDPNKLFYGRYIKYSKGASIIKSVYPNCAVRIDKNNRPFLLLGKPDTTKKEVAEIINNEEAEKNKKENKKSVVVAAAALSLGTVLMMYLACEGHHYPFLAEKFDFIEETLCEDDDDGVLTKMTKYLQEKIGKPVPIVLGVTGILGVTVGVTLGTYELVKYLKKTNRI